MIDFRFYLVTDSRNTHGRSLETVLKQTCEAGIQAVQLREKYLSPIELYNTAKKLKPMLDDYGVKLFINDRADIAAAVGASGIHLTSRSLSPDKIKKLLPKNSLIGVSTHSTKEGLAAKKQGADFILFGPIYYTPSKAKYGQPLGLDRLRVITQEVNLPVFAIGGITPGRVTPCLEKGAFGVSAISAIMESDDISYTIDLFAQKLGKL